MNPEDRFGELASRGQHNTFRVFAEWMKENREAWEAHLRKQDLKLEEIHAAQRVTNGSVADAIRRINDLEKQAELGAALADGRSRWEEQQHEEDEREFERGIRRRELVIGALGAFGVIGGAVGALGHPLGWW